MTGIDLGRQATPEDRNESWGAGRQPPDAARTQPGKEGPPGAVTFAPPPEIDSRKVYRRGRYRASQASRLLIRYASIRGDLIMAASAENDEARQLYGRAELCSHHLKRAKVELESRRQQLSVCANLLALAERELVNLYSSEVLRYRLSSVKERLRQMSPTPATEIKALDDAEALGLLPHTPDEPRIDAVRRTALKDALTCMHERADDDLLADDLQVTRLRRVMALVFGAMLALLASIPFVSAEQVDPNGNLIWPIEPFTGTTWVDLLLSAVGLAIVGAVGGVVSGMMSVRDSGTALTEYRTSMLKVYLRPLAGAISALVLYLFLSAEVVSGVEVTNAGVYVVAAFLAGFSERYFLRILRAQEQAAEQPPADHPAPAPAQQHPPVAPPAAGAYG